MKKPHQWIFYTKHAPELQRALCNLRADPGNNISGLIVKLLEPALRAAKPEAFKERTPSPMLKSVLESPVSAPSEQKTKRSRT